MNKNTSAAVRWMSIGLIAVAALACTMAVLHAAKATAASVQEDQIGIIIDPSGLDNYFNALPVAGMERAITELGVAGTVYTPTSEADMITRTQQCADDGNDLCIGVGFVLADAISATAHANPDVDFAILDSYYEMYPNNLQGMRFAAQEPSYMAGTLAALMTTSDTLGVIGGMKIPPVDDFINGFLWGAQCANPSVTTVVSYTNDFNNPDAGAAVAQEMIAEGADVLFPVAGETGVAAVLTATQSGAWAIGVDTDQYLTVFMSGTITGSEKLLTSVEKRLDNAVYELVYDYVAGTFVTGTVTYNMDMGGVALAPYHEADPAIPEGVKWTVNRAKQGILAGTIDVFGPCPTYVYLPLSIQGTEPSVQ